MEMRIDAALLKRERNRRAWSQEHLAQVTGLGLRTIQRIESSGAASNESIAAIATVLEMTVAEFLEERLDAKRAGNTGLLGKYRALIVSLIVAVANLVSPPELTVALACLWLWVLLELGMLLAGRKTGPGHA